MPAAWTAIGALALLAVSALAVGAAAPKAHVAAATPAVAPNWTQLNTSAGHPPAIIGGAAVYDAADHYVVLVGGYRVTSGGTFLPNNATWKFSGGTWTPLYPHPHPPAGASGSSPALTYDAADGYVLSFGCAGMFNGCNQTWTFHAGKWTNVTSSVAPPSAFWTSMTYDAKDGYVFMVDAAPGYIVSEWKYLHGSWTKLTVVHPPTLGTWADFQAVYDPHDGYVLFASGFNQTCKVGLTTVYYCMHSWSYVGGTFTALANATKITTTRFSVAYDAARGEVVLFGGRTPSSTFSGTFAFRGGVWHTVLTVASPPPRSVAAMAYDTHDRYILLFGGEGGSGALGPMYYYDSWSFA